MISSLLKLLIPPPTPQKMAGAGFTLMGPFPPLGHLYTMERSLQAMNLKGWMKMTEEYNIEMELHGSFETISQFIRQLDDGSALQARVRYEMLWLPYESGHSRFTYRVLDNNIGTSLKK